MALTREFYYARIATRLGELTYQIKMRGRTQMYDLHKHCENFSKRLLNEVLDMNFENLNKERSNEPGIDLGDKHKKIAVQVTAQKTSTKVTATLNQVLKEKHNETYGKIIILILGEKQTGYTIDADLMRKTNFDPDKNIIGIVELLKMIEELTPQKMKNVWDIIRSEMSDIYDELDISQGELFGIPALEDKPDIVYTNCVALLEYQNTKYGVDVTPEEEKVMDADFTNLLSELRDLPDVTRKFFCSLCKCVNFNKVIGDVISLSYQETLRNIKRVDPHQFRHEINILSQRNLIIITDLEEMDQRIEFYGPCVNSAAVYNIIDFCLAYNINMDDPITNLDFSAFAK